MPQSKAFPSGLSSLKFSECRLSSQLQFPIMSFLCDEINLTPPPSPLGSPSLGPDDPLTDVPDMSRTAADRNESSTRSTPFTGEIDPDLLSTDETLTSRGIKRTAANAEIEDIDQLARSIGRQAKLTPDNQAELLHMASVRPSVSLDAILMLFLASRCASAHLDLIADLATQATRRRRYPHGRGPQKHSH